MRERVLFLADLLGEGDDAGEAAEALRPVVREAGLELAEAAE